MCRNKSKKQRINSQLYIPKQDLIEFGVLLKAMVFKLAFDIGFMLIVDRSINRTMLNMLKILTKNDILLN